MGRRFEAEFECWGKRPSKEAPTTADNWSRPTEGKKSPSRNEPSENLRGSASANYRTIVVFQQLPERQSKEVGAFFTNSLRTIHLSLMTAVIQFKREYRE